LTITNVSNLKDDDWKELIDNICDGKCTPFIGAGASARVLPTASKIAEELAEEYDYPLKDTYDLARVAQYVAISRDPMVPRKKIRDSFRQAGRPDFSEENEPHALLADLNLPIYLTTNYDDFMFKALERDRGKKPVRDFCRWNNHPDVVKTKSVLDGTYEPTSMNPLVYHLHGYTDILQSMVLTETDYLDFLIRMSRDNHLLPPRIQEALAGSSLLFLGYRLSDWNFKVIMRGITSSLGADLAYCSFSVQLKLKDHELRSDKVIEFAHDYLQTYLGKIQKIKIRVYWGDLEYFCAELRRRWRELNGG
jgi:hypothetical protein